MTNLESSPIVDGTGPVSEFESRRRVDKVVSEPIVETKEP
jgi:hypothetical protein